MPDHAAAPSSVKVAQHPKGSTLMLAQGDGAASARRLQRLRPARDQNKYGYTGGSAAKAVH